MTAPRFDELIHVPARLSIVALLAPTDGVEFAFLRDRLGLSDSALSKHISALSAAEYVAVRKENRGRGIRRTWIHLTERGLAALNGHIAALNEILAGADRPSSVARVGPQPAGQPQVAPRGA